MGPLVVPRPTRSGLLPDPSTRGRDPPPGPGPRQNREQGPASANVRERRPLPARPGTCADLGPGGRGLGALEGRTWGGPGGKGLEVLEGPGGLGGRDLGALEGGAWGPWMGRPGGSPGGRGLRGPWREGPGGPGGAGLGALEGSGGPGGAGRGRFPRRRGLGGPGGRGLGALEDGCESPSARPWTWLDGWSRVADKVHQGGGLEPCLHPTLARRQTSERVFLYFSSQNQSVIAETSENTPLTAPSSVSQWVQHIHYFFSSSHGETVNKWGGYGGQIKSMRVTPPHTHTHGQ